MEETKVVENKSEASVSKKTSGKKKANGGAFAGIASFFTGVKAELSKIIWPTQNDMVKQTTAVVVVSAICCALIAVLDYAFGYGMNFIMSIFSK